MIPLLERVLPKQDAELQQGRIHLIKLHNGYGFRQPKVCFVVFHQGRALRFLKTVRTPNDRSMTESAFTNLCRAEEVCSKARLDLKLPHALWIMDVEGVPVSAETILLGRALNPFKSTERLLAISHLVRLESATISGHRTVDEMRAFVHGWIDRLQSQHVKLRSLLMDACDEGLARCSSEARFPIISSHGDATPSNILWLEQGGIGMIDWDDFGEIDIPLFDLLTFFERATPEGENTFMLFRMELESAALAQGIDRHALPLLGLLALLATDIRKRRRCFSWEPALWDEDLFRMCEQRLTQMRVAWQVAGSL